jgi:hypothetical protein
VLQAGGEAGEGGNLAHGQQDAGHEADTVRGVMADAERLPRTAEDHLLWTWTPPCSAPRAPARTSTGWAGPGLGATEDSARPARISRTVASDVPEGESRLVSWCSSITSASGIHTAAIRAKRIIITAPMAKLGA